MKKNEIVWHGAYGIEVVIPKPAKSKPDLIERKPAPHGIRDCGRHYNIWEADDGFPQDRFFINLATKNL